MTEKIFCYHCRSSHPIAEMTLLEAKGIKRWRCRKSISLSQGSTAQRDAFGKAVSELNEPKCCRRTGRPLPHPVLELFGRAPGNIESPE